MDPFKSGSQPIRRGMFVWLLLLLSTCIALSCIGQAQQTFFVAKNGNVSNSGSASAPWLTVGHAAQQAQAGDTVMVGAGTYNESVTFANSGTAFAPIVFNGEGVAVVDGTGVSCCLSPTFAQSNGFIVPTPRVCSTLAQPMA